jgi:hypothetical protein
MCARARRMYDGAIAADERFREFTELTLTHEPSRRADVLIREAL